MVKEKATLGGVAVLIAGSSRSVWWQTHLKTALRPSGALCGENWGTVAADTKPAAPLVGTAGVVVS